MIIDAQLLTMRNMRVRNIAIYYATQTGSFENWPYTFLSFNTLITKYS